MAQYLVKETTARRLIHVSDQEAAAYRAEGWTDATAEDIEAWRREDIYGGLQGHPPPPPLTGITAAAAASGPAAGGVPGTAAPAPQGGQQAPWAPSPADDEARAQADADAQQAQQVEAKTRLVPYTLPPEPVSPTHPPITEGEPAPGSSLAQAQAAGQLPAEAVQGDLSVPAQGDATAVPGPGGATVFPTDGAGAAVQPATDGSGTAVGQAPADGATAPSPAPAAESTEPTGLFGAPADVGPDTDADEAPAPTSQTAAAPADEHQV